MIRCSLVFLVACDTLLSASIWNFVYFSALGSLIECERVLGCQIAPKQESHRASKCDMPFVVRIGGVINCDYCSDQSGSGACVRVHIALTYAGRPMTVVCSPNTGPKDTKRYLGYEPTIPANRDSYFSQKADHNGKINMWIRFQGALGS